MTASSHPKLCVILYASEKSQRDDNSRRAEDEPIDADDEGSEVLVPIGRYYLQSIHNRAEAAAVKQQQCCTDGGGGEKADLSSIAKRVSQQVCDKRRSAQRDQERQCRDSGDIQEKQ